MIIKSMSRKHPSFAQLIDYIEGEAKLKSRHHSIHHNLYSRDRERLKREFEDNARHLKHRKNGVYLYHEVLSITRSQYLTEDEQKTRLQRIVEAYLNDRAKHNLAYAVLHEDTDNLHFHIIMSANEAGDSNRKRLSKAEFASIQTSLEKWVLTHHSELEQKPVFHKNQTTAERAEREEKRKHLSDKGEQMKRRGAKTDKRDQVQESLADIFATATDPRHFAELMERAGFALYTRGNTHGITDREGNKYRLARLGLADEWERMDERMKSYFHAERVKQDEHDRHEAKPTPETTTARPRAEEQADRTATKTTTEQDPIQTEAEKRLAQMKEIRAKRAEKQQQQQQANTRKQGRER